jgi:hypothetical protein
VTQRPQERQRKHKPAPQPQTSIVSISGKGGYRSREPPALGQPTVCRGHRKRSGTAGRRLPCAGDMDAMRPEENEVDYIPESGSDARLGHDGHTANLLGTAFVLNQLRDVLPPGVSSLFFSLPRRRSGARMPWLERERSTMSMPSLCSMDGPTCRSGRSACVTVRPWPLQIPSS